MNPRNVARIAALLLAAAALLLGHRLWIPGVVSITFDPRDEGRVFEHRLSSGLFSLPPNAASLDWTLENPGEGPETARVTVYRHGGGLPRMETLPGPLLVQVPAGGQTHNANPVGPGEVFEPGFSYEVVVETDSRTLRPTVAAWSDHVATVIPASVIPPERFSRQ